MGIAISFMWLGAGMQSGQTLDFVTGVVYKQLMEKEIQNFDDFLDSILDIVKDFRQMVYASDATSTVSTDALMDPMAEGGDFRQMVYASDATSTVSTDALMDPMAEGEEERKARTANAALPGKRYDVWREKVETAFVSWKEAQEKDKKNIFVEFMKDDVLISKVDDTTMIAGILTPPIAMAAKRAGEHIPKLNMIRAIPDLYFIPAVTVLVLKLL